ATELPPGILPFTARIRACDCVRPVVSQRSDIKPALLADSGYSSTGVWGRQRKHRVGVSEGNTLKRENRQTLWKTRKISTKKQRAQPGLRSWTVSNWVSNGKFESRRKATRERSF